MRFRVAEPAVEFDRARLAVRVDHQAGVQKTGERHALFGHALDGRQDDFLHRLGVHVGRDHRRGRVRAHAAGVGALIAVEQPLVVLAGRQRDHVLAVAQHDEAGFLAFQEGFDHHARLRLAVGASVVLHAQGVGRTVGAQHPVDRLVRLCQRRRHHHALAGGQAVGLDDDGRAVRIDVRMGCCSVGERRIRRGGDLVTGHEGLGVRLGAFKLCGGLRGPEDAQPTLTKEIDDASGQRTFGADHRERDLFADGELGQLVEVGQRQVVQPAIKRGAAVAGRDIDRLHAGRLQQLPGDRVLASAGANHENFHAWALMGTTPRCGKPPGCRPCLRSGRAVFACVLRLHRRVPRCFRRAS